MRYVDDACAKHVDNQTQRINIASEGELVRAALTTTISNPGARLCCYEIGCMCVGFVLFVGTHVLRAFSV